LRVLEAVPPLLMFPVFQGFEDLWIAASKSKFASLEETRDTVRCSGKSIID
jgi:hypothetical protein